VLLEAVRAHLDRHAPGDFAHGREQRQGSIASRHGFVGDRGGARGQQRVGLRGIGRQVEIGEQGLIRAQSATFLQLRLLYFQHEVRIAKHGAGVAHDGRAGIGINRIAQAYTVARAGLHQDFVTLGHQLAGAGGDDRHPGFANLDLSGNTNSHTISPALTACRLVE
jgi:hypothetical protein